MVFQDPFGSLDPRQKVARIVAEPLALERVGRSESRARVVEVLEAVGLKASDTDKYPHEFSGGQRQRIAIARALVTRPALIVADEPVSALDVSVQAQVLNLLEDLREEFGVTYMLISHDLAVVQYVCEEVMVMNAGVVVEHGPTDDIFADAAPRLHPHAARRRAAAAGDRVAVALASGPGVPRARAFPDVSSGARRVPARRSATLVPALPGRSPSVRSPSSRAPCLPCASAGTTARG